MDKGRRMPFEDRALWTEKLHRLAGTTVGLAGRLLGWLQGMWSGRVQAAQARPRLAVLDRITLGPKQNVALVEVEGRRFLIATGPDGSPCFHALEQAGQALTPHLVRRSDQVGNEARVTSLDRAARAGRISW